MSKLYFTERGRVVPTLCEELTYFRRARKLMLLPQTQKAGRLFVSALAHPGTGYPLQIAVNGKELTPLQPDTLTFFHWFEVEVPAAWLKAGPNQFEFWTGSHGMDSWSLAMEAGFQDPDSQLSTDGGATWSNQAMGYHHVSRAEYLVRIRLTEGEDPQPPCWIPEDPACIADHGLRQRLPDAALTSDPTLDRVKAITSWISTGWEYHASGSAAQYAPWDLDTIFSWGLAKRGHNHRPPIVMCVHYGIAFVTACQAAGIQARAAIFTGNIGGVNGHFAAEVWMPEFNKWIFVDPNVDLIISKGGVPLSIPEIRSLLPDLSSYFRWGPGMEFHKSNPEIAPFIENYRSGPFLGHRSIWPRADFLANPRFSPPGHGSLSYCETDLVWEQKDLDEGFGMFPYFASEAYFNEPPSHS